MNKPKLLVSSCLMGNAVRFDGGHTCDEFISQKLPLFFEMTIVCPELSMGLGVPREPVHLKENLTKDIRMIGIKSGIDHTEKAILTSFNLIAENKKNISGAILQKKSPSCGVERVKLYDSKGNLHITEKGSSRNRGIFANHLIDEVPFLPVIDSGRLWDRNERENFLRRVLAYDRFYKLDGSIADLQDFHARYKFVIMEHDQNHMRVLGKIAANSLKNSQKDVYIEYAQLFFQTLKIIPSVKNRTNVLSHLLGFFKNDLKSNEKNKILALLEDYRKNIIPYMVPYHMLEYLIIKYEQKYLSNHYYLNQFPKELLTA